MKDAAELKRHIYDIVGALHSVHDEPGTTSTGRRRTDLPSLSRQNRTSGSAESAVGSGAQSPFRATTQAKAIKGLVFMCTSIANPL